MYVSEPTVIYEDKNFLAVNKPAGLLVHAARSGDSRGSGKDSRFKNYDLRRREREGTLVEWLLKKCPVVRNVGDDPATRPGIVHRLDKDTSGVLLVAKTREGFEYLKSLFQNREIKKTYLAWVWGVPQEKRGRIESAIAVKSGTVRRTVHKGKMEKSAVTEYRFLKSCIVNHGSFSLLEVVPHTGRTHQIRVHLASIGHPVAGDAMYGGKRQRASSNWHLATGKNKKPEARSQKPAARLMLHALSVEFTAQDGKRIRIEAEPPEEFGA